MKHKGCGGEIMPEDDWVKITKDGEKRRVGLYPFRKSDGETEFRKVLRCKECGKVITGDNEISPVE